MRYVEVGEALEVLDYGKLVDALDAAHREAPAERQDMLLPGPQANSGEFFLIRAAWQGRISGCQMGKAVELLSMREGLDALRAYLDRADALPIRDYIPLVPGTSVARQFANCCRGRFDRSEPDDDINYSVLALMMLEEHGADLTTADVDRSISDASTSCRLPQRPMV